MTDYAKDGLRIDKDTTPEEVREFVERRTKNPVVERKYGLTVWDYSTHEPDMEALREIAPRLQGSRFLIPYQVAGPWSYMQELLPEDIRVLPLLAYSEQREEYRVYDNFLYTGDVMDDMTKRAELEDWLEEYES